MFQNTVTETFYCALWYSILRFTNGTGRGKIKFDVDLFLCNFIQRGKIIF